MGRTRAIAIGVRSVRIRTVTRGVCAPAGAVLCALWVAALAAGPSLAQSQQPQPWDLRKLVRYAVDNNKGLAAVRSASEAAREGIDAARGERLPKLDAVGLGEYFPRRERVLIFRHGGPPRNRFQDAIVNYGLEVTLPLYTSGRIEHGITLAEALADAARFRIDVTRNELIFNVAATYYTALRLQQVIAAQEAALASLRESLRVAEFQREVGRLAPLDLLRIQTRVSQAERDLVGARTAYEQAVEVLKELAALPPEAVIDVAGDLRHESLREANNVESLRQRALDNRPDLVAVRHEVQAQREAVGIADARLGPTVDLNAGYRGVTGVDDGTTRDDATIFLKLRFPLYSGGVLEARRRQELAKLREAEFRLRDAERRVLGETDRAVLDLRAAGPKVEAGQRAVGQGTASLRVERQNLAEGRGVTNDLLLAEEALLRARTELAAALADSQIARAALNLAVGEAPVPIDSPPGPSGGVPQ